jgi:hypothetical protein
MVAELIWAGPGRWLSPAALPMRGPVAAGGDPVPPAEIPSSGRALELDAMLVPGLQDAHIHSGLIDLIALRSGGISAALDLGGVPEQVSALRRASLDPTAGLPGLEIVGAFLTCPGGYPSGRSWAAPGSWREVRSTADAEMAVAEQVAVGAGAVKVAINVDAGPVLPSPVLAAIAAAAHGAGLRVIAHAEGEGAVRTALTAGVDVLAHTPWTEELDVGLLRACAEQTTWISTTNIHGRSDALTVAMANLSGFLDLGGSLRYGTDLGNGNLPLGVNSQETLVLQTLGLSVDDVLAAMTGPILGPTATVSAQASRFVAGVAPCVLANPLDPQLRVVGPYLREAQVFSAEDITDLEPWQG